MSDKEKRELLHRILDLVIDINGLEERKVNVSGDKPTAFLYFSGHTADLDVQVHEKGWNPFENISKRYFAYFDGDGKGLEKVVSDLEAYKEAM